MRGRRVYSSALRVHAEDTMRHRGRQPFQRTSALQTQVSHRGSSQRIAAAATSPQWSFRRCAALSIGSFATRTLWSRLAAAPRGRCQYRVSTGRQSRRYAAVSTSFGFPFFACTRGTLSPRCHVRVPEISRYCNTDCHANECQHYGLSDDPCVPCNCEERRVPTV